MRLHRLSLTNFRGVGHRDIEFPDHGVVVVAGPNEIGKSSMIEALDLLLEARDRSSKKEVKRVKPTHADVGTEVTAEISTGPYRFVYRKRFHKRPETELTVLAPCREQLTGDEAHDRVAAILADTLDTGLWRAQRVLQAASTDAVDLSGCDALSRALDIAAGDTATLTGAEPVLIERIDAEHGRYFTPTGRPTGEWSAAIARLKAAETEVARCTAQVAEVDQRVVRHAELTEQLAELDRRRDTVTARHDAARSAADALARLNAELHDARLKATAARATCTASMAANTERARLRDDFDSRAAALAASEAEITTAGDNAAMARDAASAAETAARQAVAQLDAARQRAESARRIIDRLCAREEADRLAARLDRIDGVDRELTGITAALSAVTLTPAMLAAIEEAAAGADRADARLAAVSASVQITAASDVELVVGGEQLMLGPGETWSTIAPTDIDVPGLLTVRVSPGATALDVQAEYDAAQQLLAAALASAGVADLSTAKAIEQHRQELHHRRDQLNATLSGLCGDDEQPAQLRARLAQLRIATSGAAELGDIDAATARAELQVADTAHAAAESHCEAQRAVAAAAAAQLSESATRATVLQETVAARREELTALAYRLTAQRATSSDAALAAAAAADEQAAQAAERHATEVSDKVAAAGPDAVAGELADAATAVEALHSQRDSTERELHNVTAQLAVLGTEGRQSQLHDAEVDHEHAAAEHAGVARRAQAAQLLRSVMTNHRDNTRRRYVEPFRAEVERLGRPVFGESFEVEVDSQLCIANRTLDGCTVTYESLSGGAKEQLGILARLAGAALVAKEDTVPVLIDDALGFTDPTRLASMATVFDEVGAHGQVIVLTCTPERYRGVEGAHRIDLTA